MDWDKVAEQYIREGEDEVLVKRELSYFQEKEYGTLLWMIANKVATPMAKRLYEHIPTVEIIEWVKNQHPLVLANILFT